MILLTGANGFVGNVLYRRINSLNFSVKAVLRSTASGVDSKKTSSLGDIPKKTDWSEALIGIDTVVHLAARVHVMRETSHDPLAEFRLSNVEATVNLAQQAANTGVKRFIFLSTIKVNGELTQHGQKFKSDDIPNPEDAYALSKMEAEIALLEIAKETGMEVVIIRSPLVYGPGVKANFRSLMSMVSKGFPLPLGAINNNRRSLVGVDNLVDFIITCTTHPGASNQIFLVSDDEDLSTTDLLKRMYKAADTPEKLFNLPLWCLKLCLMAVRKESVYTRLCGSLQIDIDKSKQVLGWSPPLSVDEGLRRAFGGLE